MTKIQTERLLLRRPMTDDLEPMFEIMSDPQAMRYWSTLPHPIIAATHRWLDQMLERTAGGGEDFIAVHKGKVIGTIGAGRLPDFGFILHPQTWGQGFATEASRAFISHAFANTTTTSLEADVDPRNLASLAVLKRLGFNETGRASRTFLLGDEWCDSIYLSLPRPSDYGLRTPNG